MTPALELGLVALLAGLWLLRSSQPPGRIARPDPGEVRGRARRRRLGVGLAALAPILAGTVGGARDVVLLLAAGGLLGWSLAVSAGKHQPLRQRRERLRP